jgi:hypothetical protein
MAIEEPAFELVEETPEYELRRYEPQILAETEVPGPFDKAGNRAFGILADYIFGANRSSEKIAMTAPVSQRPATAEENDKSIRIEMTAPVTQRTKQGASGPYVLSFVMPARFKMETLPRPDDARVRLREQPGRLMAVRRYSGGWSEARYRVHEAQLLEALRADGLTPVGEPVYARYNSPFSLPFLRRNEVMVEVAGNGD